MAAKLIRTTVVLWPCPTKTQARIMGAIVSLNDLRATHSYNASASLTWISTNMIGVVWNMAFRMSSKISLQLWSNLFFFFTERLSSLNRSLVSQIDVMSFYFLSQDLSKCLTEQGLNDIACFLPLFHTFGYHNFRLITSMLKIYVPYVKTSNSITWHNCRINFIYSINIYYVTCYNKHV